MRPVCPRCGNDEVRGSKIKATEDVTVFDRYCPACDLFEDRLSTDDDLTSWLDTWEAPGEAKPLPNRAPPTSKRPPPPRRLSLAERARDEEERALLQAVIDDPEADEPRVAYADWLVERGDPRGPFILSQLELAELRKARAPHARSGPVFRRSKELLDRHGGPWKEGLRAWIEAEEVRFPMFYRGFIERIEISADVFLESFEAITAAEPIRFLKLTEVGDRAAEVFASPMLRRIRALDLGGASLRDAAVEQLAASPQAAGLRWLDLSFNPALTEAALEAIAASPLLKELAYLNFRDNAAEDPRDEVHTDGDVVVWAGASAPGQELEARHGPLAWLHWPEAFAFDLPDPEAFC